MFLNRLWLIGLFLLIFVFASMIGCGGEKDLVIDDEVVFNLEETGSMTIEIPLPSFLLVAAAPAADGDGESDDELPIRVYVAGEWNPSWGSNLESPPPVPIPGRTSFVEDLVVDFVSGVARGQVRGLTPGPWGMGAVFLQDGVEIYKSKEGLTTLQAGKIRPVRFVMRPQPRPQPRPGPTGGIDVTATWVDEIILLEPTEMLPEDEI